MIAFLTSSTTIPGTEELNPANGFLEQLTACFPQPCHALFVCSSPDSFEMTDGYGAATRAGFAAAGLYFDSLQVLDNRTVCQAESLVREANLIILAGGHVPTQNRFFERIGLREILKDYDGVIIGISAGSMNSADTVYAQPELDGEATNPTYQKFLSGLGLTKTNLLPHYQWVKDQILDGLRLYPDITLADSRGRTFYAISDGSYLLIKDGREELIGESYLVQDGQFQSLCRHGEQIQINTEER